jgi:hypothetical protein
LSSIKIPVTVHGFKGFPLTAGFKGCIFDAPRSLKTDPFIDSLGNAMIKIDTHVKSPFYMDLGI